MEGRRKSRRWGGTKGGSEENVEGRGERRRRGEKWGRLKKLREKEIRI